MPAGPRATAGARPADARGPGGNLLEVRGLTTRFRSDEGSVWAVNDVSFSVAPGEAVGVVGESGSGKSVTFLSVIGLVPDPPGEVLAGEVMFEGEDLRKLSGERLRKVRGDGIGMIFQDPLTSLNPVFTIGDQMIAVIRSHRKVSKKAARDRAIEMLDLVQIPNARERIDAYPHHFSGGMRQRVMIALALSLEPRLLIADEPTTALDVTMQAQVLELIDGLRQDLDLAVVLITHDLGVVAGYTERVMVMYGGRIVEQGTCEQVFYDPQHAYTASLLKSMPRLDSPYDEELLTISGNPPDLARLPKGCAFEPRCFIGNGDVRCLEERPALEERDGGRLAACHYSERVGEARR
jgi:oligopeptide/dipeptide ABC transporter ATP-binding protein